MRIPMIAAAAMAATVLAMGSASAQTGPSPDAAQPTAPAQAHAAHRLRDRFEAANTTHDGHLTQAQAGGMVMVARNFDAIDADHKGYVTLQDVHAFARARRAARQSNPSE